MNYSGAVMPLADNEEPILSPPAPQLNNPIQLPSDILLGEILLRLPSKSLVRFKSVCKNWLSIISSDDFCHKHTLLRPKLQPSVILEVNSRELFYFNPTINGETKTKAKKMSMIPYSKSVPCCKVVKASNGLMLLRFTDRSGYCIYNLTTRRSRKIALSRNDKYPSVAMINLAFDPSTSPYYKIVCFRSNYLSFKNFTYHIEVYDSESHTWKLNPALFTSPIDLSSVVGTYWNNGIYWSNGNYVYRFDIGKNEIKAAFPSPHPALLCSAPNLEESNGKLYCYGIHSKSKSIAVWELGDSSDDGRHHQPRWKSKYGRKELKTCMHEKNGLRLMMGRSDVDETSWLFQADGRKIRTYNFLHKKSMDGVLDLKTQPCYQPQDGSFSVTVFPFGETLALV